MNDRPEKLEDVERPESIGNPRMGWASDVMAEIVHRLGFKYISLTPGASYRGLHDSLVNYLGNADPQLVLSLHEENAVAVAHGYAKVTDEPLAVAIHANIGLMHAIMAIYNAWCDRVPMFILGATGPVDAAQRRPWIEWIHTSKDQASMIRQFVKWDDQPASVSAAAESLLRAAKITRTHPHAPVYICLDQALQEQALEGETNLPEVARYRPPAPPAPAPDALRAAADALRAAKYPVILPGRVSRRQDAWDARVRLAEALRARVMSDTLVAANFPARHPLHLDAPRPFLSKTQQDTLRQADVILSLDRVDLAGTLRTVWPDDRVDAAVISVTPDQHAHNGWAMDHQGLAPADITLLTHPDAAVPALLSEIERSGPVSSAWPDPGGKPGGGVPPVAKSAGPISMDDLAACFNRAAAEAEKPVTLTRLPFGWPGGAIAFEGPLDYLGRDGGAGVGSAPGISVGAALAIREKGGERLPVAITGDGEYIMGLTALWTAARYRLPLLVVVANNRSFYNDVEHQERMARARNRPVQNKFIGMEIDGPPMNLAGLARDQGVEGFGPVEDVKDLPAALALGFRAVADGRTAVIDVVVVPGRE